MQEISLNQIGIFSTKTASLPPELAPPEIKTSITDFNDVKLKMIAIIMTRIDELMTIIFHESFNLLGGWLGCCRLILQALYGGPNLHTLPKAQLREQLHAVRLFKHKNGVPVDVIRG